MEITYSKNGDYLIPDLVMDAQPSGSIGKYGRMRKSFLKEHRKGTYGSLLLQGTLTAHLLEIDQTARAQVEQMMKQMAKAEGVTEELKANDQMAWVGRMNNIKQRAEEVVIVELVHG
ncbi:MAG TPA: TnpV protein [Clostridia bacterium]|nr:TnpV protein [Clostridia bacterium]